MRTPAPAGTSGPVPAAECGTRAPAGGAPHLTDSSGPQSGADTAFRLSMW
jgi:hypothetical protein